MPDYAALDSVVARLRSSNWKDLNELANAFAVALSAVARQPTFNRGLHDNVIADASGGTTLGVGDNSASRVSTSLQPPQRGFLIKHGAISTRRQARVEADVKTLPAKVLSATGAGADVELSVAYVGDRPVIDTDQTTNQNKPGNINQTLTQTAEQLQDDGTTIGNATVPGTAFVNNEDEDAHGPKIPEAGQTINVTVSKQYEKSTIWHQRGNRSWPSVKSTLVSQSAIGTNGLCCKEPGSGDSGGS